MAAKPSDAESIFQKDKEEMTELERMMADIIQEKGQDAEGSQSPKTTSKETEEKKSQTYAAPAPPNRARRGQPAPAHSSPSHQKPRASETHNVTEPANDYRKKEKTGNNSRKMKKKKKSSSSLVLILIVIALLVVGVLVYSKVFRDIGASMPGAVQTTGTTTEETVWTDTAEPVDSSTEEDAAAMAAVSFPPDMIFPTPEPEESLNEDGTIKAEPPAGSIVIMSGTEIDETETSEETETADGVQTAQEVEHRYEFYKEDVSWTEAQQRCLEKGGHLVVISDEDELNTVITLATENGIQKVWVGCHRENGELVWENDEQSDYFVWGKGEPSLIDSGDQVTEDYVLLWRFNGAWVYNDSRNDPVADYPDMYSGQIGYVCEYGK